MRIFTMVAGALLLASPLMEAEAGTVSLGSVTVEPGQTVEVPIYYDSEDPIRGYVTNFTYDEERLRYLGLTLDGSDAAAGDPFSILWRAFPGGEANGGYFSQRRHSQGFRLPPGERVHLGSLRFLVRASSPAGPTVVDPVPRISATAGESTVTVDRSASGGTDFDTVKPEAFESGTITVAEPVRPRPVSHLTCVQFIDHVVLSFSPTESYDEVNVLRDGTPAGTLPGPATSWEEEIPGLGRHHYEVVAIRGEETSLAAACDVIVVTPAAPAILELTCDSSGLAWKNATAYDGIHVLRNEEPVADLPGDATAWIDPEPPEGLTLYSVVAEVDGYRSPAARCVRNGVWVQEVGDVLVDPGARTFELPISVTTSTVIQGLDVYLEMDTSHFELVRDPERELAGTMGAPDPEYYLMGARGRTGGPAFGLIWDYHAPTQVEKDLSPGLRQHVVSFVWEIVDPVPEGTVLPVRIVEGNFTLRGGVSQPVETYVPGEIRFGGGGPAPVEILEAHIDAPPGRGDGGGGALDADVELTWQNGDDYDTVRVERDGEVIAELDGSQEVYRDEGVTSGVYTYKVRGMHADLAGFPRSTLVSTFRPPGAFLRGDADRDGRLTINDPARTLHFLFLGGEGLACEDAADTDDDGALSIADPVASLSYLFAGGRVPVAPGVRYPWFDPTPDGLTCGE